MPRHNLSLQISHEEMKLFCKKKSVSNTASAKVGVDMETAIIMMMIKKFSSLNKLIRSVAYYLQYRLLLWPITR